MSVEGLTDGAILVDKPAGISSAKVIAILKRQFKIEKIGHAGTLDPFATGLLVVLIGKGCRLQSLLQEGAKSYEGEVMFGLSTSSDDITGDVLQRDDDCSFLTTVSEAELFKRIELAFLGEQEQLPPRVSAIKHQGQRSYKLERQGIVFEPQKRQVVITSLELELRPPKGLGFRLSCSKGTYIRAFARDVGQLFDSCACLKSLRRLTVGQFNVDSALSLEALRQFGLLRERLINLRELVCNLPQFVLSPNETSLVRQGNALGYARINGQLEQMPEKHSLAALFSELDENVAAVLKRDEDGKWRFKCVL